MMHGSKKRKRSVSRFSGKIPLCFLCRQRLAQEMHHIQPMKFGGENEAIGFTVTGGSRGTGRSESLGGVPQKGYYR